MNKIIKHYLKTRIESLKGGWAEELPSGLWSYRTTAKTTTRETPFSLAFGTEAVIRVEIGLPSLRIREYDLVTNDERLRVHLDLLDELREALISVQKQRISRYYNTNVRSRMFQ